MKNKTFIALFTALLAVALLVSGCAFNAPDTVGKGTLSLSVKGLGGGRTILPQVTYVATITTGTTEVLKQTLLPGVNVIALDPGTYDITVDGFYGDEKVLTGSATGVELEANKGASAVIELDLVDDSATQGTFAWDLSDFTGTAEINIYEITGAGGTFGTPVDIELVDGGPEEFLGGDGGKTQFGSYGTVGSFDIPASTNLKNFVRMEFDLDTYIWAPVDPADPDDPQPDEYDFVQVFNTSSYSNNIAHELVDGDGERINEEWNTTTADGTLFTWNLSAAQKAADYSGGDGKVIIRYKQQATFPVSKVVVRSVKFIVDVNAPLTDFYSSDIDSLGTPDETADELVGSVELDAGVYFVEFNVGDTTWNEVLVIVAGLTSEYAPSFYDVFAGTGDKLLDLVLASLEEGNINFTVPELTTFGILGVSAGNIGDVRAAVSAILGVDGNEAPEDLDGLKVLIDAALVAAGASDTDPTDATGSETYFATLPKNGTTIDDVDWDAWEDDYSVTFTVGDPDEFAYTFSVYIFLQPEFIEEFALAQNIPVYKFELADNFGEYTGIKVNYFIDADNIGKNIRFNRLYGAFNDVETRFVDKDGVKHLDFSANTDINDFIYDDLGGAWGPAGNISGAAANTWFTVTYKLVGNSPNNTNPQKYPDADDDSPVYFGLGIPGQDDAPITTKVKNITLVHGSDPGKNVILTTDDFYGFAGYGPETSFGKTSRKIVYNPSYTGDITPFYLDLKNFATTGVYSNSGDLSIVDGKLVAKFTANDTRAVIKLTEGDIARLRATGAAVGSATPNGKLKITVTATLTQQGDGTNSYRYHIGDYTTGSSWNYTASFDAGAFATTIAGTRDVNVNSATPGATLNNAGFILQYRGGAVADGGNPAIVTITSIKIEVER